MSHADAYLNNPDEDRVFVELAVFGRFSISKSIWETYSH